jgi:hypothetical protein
MEPSLFCFWLSSQDFVRVLRGGMISLPDNQIQIGTRCTFYERTSNIRISRYLYANIGDRSYWTNHI